jgi:hypothetical protein
MPILAFIFSLFTGPFGKIFSYGTIILTVVGGAYGYLKWEEHEAAEAALAKFNAAQAAQTAKDNAANAAALQQALEDQAALQKQVDADNAKLATQVGNTNTWIAQQKPSGTALDPIYNQTLQKMRGY